MHDVPDGKSYVDAVTAAGQRSRALIYFILILAVLTFASIRNSYSPDWAEQEYLIYQAVLNCYENSNCKEWDDRLIAAGFMTSGADEKQRTAARQQADKVFGEDFEGLRPSKTSTSNASTGDLNAPVNLRQQELETALENLQKKDLDNDTITIPILGTAININDLWIVSGALMFFLLHFLRASLQQEYRNIKFIIQHKPEFAQLAIMNQVLAPHGLNMGYFGQILELGVGLLPSIVYSYLWCLDLSTTGVSLVYVGELRTYLEYSLEAALVLMVIYVNVRCLYMQFKIRNLIRPILL